MKPLNLIVVYILTIINFVILLLPFTAVAFAIMQINQEYFLTQIAKLDFKFLLSLLIFIISFIMIIYLFLDFIFGFSVRSSLKGCKKYDSIKDFKFLKLIFEQVQESFGRKDVKLYISNSNEINAFAIGSMGRKIMVLTQGIIQHSLNNSKDKREFLLILRSIMGHEMSHLVNKDYLPALLIIINQKATNLISNILKWMITIPLTILGYVRVRSRILFDIVMFIYSTVNKIVTFFNNKIIFNSYEFIRKFISRSIEYRCDRQSAQAFGGHNMGIALSLFGDNGYFTLFSTHPNTTSRINKVKNLARKPGVIRPLISSSISNYIAFMLLIIISSSTASYSGADELIRYYIIENHEILYDKITYIFDLAYYKIYPIIESWLNNTN